MINTSIESIAHGGLSDRQYYLVLVLLMLVAIFPILANNHIPLADLPNHLARVHIWQVSGTDNAVPFVSPVWALQPNLALDLIVGAFATIMPIEDAGRVFIILTILSMVLGPAIFGKRLNGYFTVWSFAPLLVVYNRLFYWGFLGYLFSIGIAIAVSSIWLEDSLKRKYFIWMLKGSLGAAAVLICHLYAYGFLGLVVAGISLHKVIENSSSSLLANIGHFAKRMAPVVAPLPIFAMTSPALKTTYAIEWGPPIGKISSIVGTLIGSGFWTIPFLAMMVLAAILYLIWERYLSIPKWGVTLLGLLILIHLGMPDKLISSYGADKRLPIAIALLCCAFITGQRLLGAKQRSIIFSLFVLAVVLKSLSIQYEWKDYQKIHAEHMTAFELLKPKSSIIHLVGTANPAGLPKMPLTEEAGYAMILKSTFWPGIFAYPIHGAQAIEFSPKEAGYPPSSPLQKIPLNMLAQVVSGQSTNCEYDTRRLSQCFDYMIVSSEDGTNGNLPGVSFFGPAILSSKHVTVYGNNSIKNCTWNRKY